MSPDMVYVEVWRKIHCPCAEERGAGDPGINLHPVGATEQMAQWADASP